MVVKYRNVRVKMANGRTRLQRARVMATGKLKFVKNKKAAKRSTKKATKARAKTTTTKRSKSSKSSNSGGNRTSKQGVTIPLGTVVPGGLGTYLTVKDTVDRFKANGAKAAFRICLIRMSGVDIDKKFGEAGFWRPQEAFFTIGWGVGRGVSWLVGKKAGVNATLGRARFPIFRV